MDKLIEFENQIEHFRYLEDREYVHIKLSKYIKQQVQLEKIKQEKRILHKIEFKEGIITASELNELCNFQNMAAFIRYCGFMNLSRGKIECGRMIIIDDYLDVTYETIQDDATAVIRPYKIKFFTPHNHVLVSIGCKKLE